MRAFILGVVAAAALAALAGAGLNQIQQTSAQAYHGSSGRLDYQESVNFYGREG